MAASFGYVLAQLQRGSLPCLAELSDAMLLERFLQRRDESAFAALVARYGSMVLRSCRRVLGDAHEAEDTFQATFLILARKAHTLRQPAALPGFLHSTARHVALKARRSERRHIHRATGEPIVPASHPDPHPDPLAQLTARELLTVLDEEVARLPSAQRSAVLLCCLEGRTQEEAARLLDWTAGSLKGHLERGRRRLQLRLRHRGIALAAALALMSVSRGEATPALLLRSTVTMAVGGAIGSSASALAGSVLQTMFWTKLAAVTALILMVALVTSASVALVYRGPAAEAPQDKSPPVSDAQSTGTNKPQVRTDAYGDPLPDGAIRRLGTLRFRHGGSIHNLLLAPDGKTLVSNDYYGTRTVCVWDVATGKLRRRLPGTFDVRNISLSPDGKLVAIGQEKAVILWDLASEKEVRRIAQSDVTGTAFSPDGKLLAEAGGPDIHLWDLATGKSIACWPWNRDPSSTVLLAFTPDGRTLVAGQQFDSKIVLWDTATGKKHLELDAKTGHIFTFVLSPDGALLATGSRTGGASIWDVKTGKLIRQLQAEGGKECFAAAFSPNGKSLATIQRHAKGQDCLYLWDVAGGKELRQIKGDFSFWRVIFSRDGKTLIAASNGAIRLLDAATGKELGPTAETPGYTRLATMSPDGRTLAYFRDVEIRFWDMRASREIGAIDVRFAPNGILSLAFSPDSRTVAASVGEYAINLWDMKTRKSLRRLQWDKKESPNGFWARGIAFSPDGRMLASGEYSSCVVRIWDAATGKPVSQIRLKDEAKDFRTIEGVAFSPDGKSLAVSGRGAATAGVGDSSRVRLWDVATGKPLPHLNTRLNDPTDKGPPDSLSHPRGPIVEPKALFSPDGRMLAMNRWQKTIPIWEATTGGQRLLLKGHKESTVCVAFAPDGRTLASASWDNTIRLWDLDTARELRKLTGHRGQANSLAFSADGKTLVSAGDDTTILFWDVADVTHRKRPIASQLTKQQWQALWEDLAKDDAAKAYTAMVQMSIDGQTTSAEMKKRLHPIRPVDPGRLAQLLKDLDSDEFAVREAASRALTKLGDVVDPALRQTLTRPGLSLELRRRLEGIAASLARIEGVRLRQLRSIEVLEMMGTAEARDLLKAIAAGEPGVRLTEQAKAALQRLANVRH